MKELRIIIAGGRDFKNFDLMNSTLNRYLLQFGYIDGYADNHYDFPNIKFVSGGAIGADRYGECYASMCHIPCDVFPADWNKHGKAAGPIRNRQMAEYASSGGEDCRGVLFAFWDGESRGTKNMIETAEKYGLEVHVIRY